MFLDVTSGVVKKPDSVYLFCTAVNCHNIMQIHKDVVVVQVR